MRILGFSILAILASVFACLGSATAQSFPIKSSEYNAATWDGYRKAEGKTRRVEDEWKSFEKGVLVRSGKSVLEYVGSNRSRSYYWTNEHGVIQESETIRIDGIEYSRRNGGTWERREEANAQFNGGSGIVESMVQASRDIVRLDNKTVRLFEEFRVERPGESLVYYKNRIWLDDDGVLLRRESSSGGLKPRTENHTSVTKYLYDPNIKIEAPIK